MSRTTWPGTRRTLACLTGALVLHASGCDRTPAWPDARGDWQRFENGSVGYSMSYPPGCTLDRHGSDVLIRYEGAPIIAVTWLTRAESERRGLWSRSEPTGATELAGRAGERYSYSHWDGPISMHTVSFVVPHRGKHLALELRMSGEELSTAQQRVVDAFVLDQPGSGG